MDLFEQAEQQKKKSGESVKGLPLAEQMRPSRFSEFVGQKSQVGVSSSLSSLLKRGHLPSLIIWGPPGCGKTTYAHILSQELERDFLSVNAIDTGAKKLKEIGEVAKKNRLYHGKRTVLFIDEIHRLNKAQQDVLLPFVEAGHFTLIGATTENPSFELNSALLSRCRLLIFERLNVEDLKGLLQQTSKKVNIELLDILSEPALENLVEQADGDARKLLNNFEILVELFQSDRAFNFPLKESDLNKVLGDKSFQYTKKGDERSHLVSAFIKSIRGGSADGGLYYLARLISAGEDVNFIARRLMILASEDIGNADPQGLVVATSAFHASHQVGLPEAGIILAQAVTYLATAPKSNRSYLAYKKAMAEVAQSGSLPVPLELRNAPTQLMKDIGYGKDYKYAHDSLTGYREMEFLPNGLRSKTFYEPTKRGHELKVHKYFQWLKENTPAED